MILAVFNASSLAVLFAVHFIDSGGGARGGGSQNTFTDTLLM